MMAIAPSDGLMTLSTYRLALRRAGLTSSDAVRAARPEQLTMLHRHRGGILRLVRDNHADVMRALFVADPLDWSVALLSSHPGSRLLSVRRGKERILSTVYPVNDGGGGEREAWAALKVALGRVPGGESSATHVTRTESGTLAPPSTARCAVALDAPVAGCLRIMYFICLHYPS